MTTRRTRRRAGRGGTRATPDPARRRALCDGCGSEPSSYGCECCGQELCSGCWGGRGGLTCGACAGRPWATGSTRQEVPVGLLQDDVFVP